MANEEIGYRGHGKIPENLAERIDLIFAPDGPQFQEGETGIDRQHHDGAEQHKP